MINIGTIQDFRGAVAVDDEPLVVMEPVGLIETAEPPTGTDDSEDTDGLDDAAGIAKSGEQA